MKELGQLIMTGISGTSLTEEESFFIENENIGGVILFSENYESPAQLAELINSIQALRFKYPLFIAVDHEGGRVVRFKKGFTPIPAMQELTKKNSPKFLFEVAEIVAKELSACGVNVNLAPVCDILTNTKNQVIGDRAFGTSEKEVSLYISSVIRGLQTNKVLACAKHFPGHGDTSKDSHFDLPKVDKTIDELRENEIRPFMKAAKSKVEFIMMAHLLIPSIDENLPTTLSPNAYKLLRDELKFSRVIISDDMEMKAITDNFGLEDAALMAIKAGADIIEYRSFECAKRAYESLSKAYQSGNLDKKLVEAKVKRIYEIKERNFKDYEPVYIPDLEEKMNVSANIDFIQANLSKA